MSNIIVAISKMGDVLADNFTEPQLTTMLNWFTATDYRMAVREALELKKIDNEVTE